jgi:hypothetical protein
MVKKKVSKENLDNFKRKLKEYSRENILFTSHAKIRAIGRGMNLDEIKENIMNPSRLVFMKKEKERYVCYFRYSKFYSHKYVLILNGKIIIITVININRNWQGSIK